jgi:hypothetical protein
LLAGKQQRLFPRNRAFPYSAVFSICALIWACRILPQINAPRNPQVQTDPLPLPGQVYSCVGVGAEGLIDLVNHILQGVDQRPHTLPNDYEEMAIPTYYRTAEEWKEPFMSDSDLTLAPPIKPGSENNSS